MGRSGYLGTQACGKVAMRTYRVALVSLTVFVGALFLQGCGAKPPPPGERLRLRGNKGAACSVDRECLSGQCVSRHCTEKIAKAGVGGECEGDENCLGETVCDKTSKKCTPKFACETFRDRLERCIGEVYVKFKPTQSGDLRRMKTRAKRRFLRKINTLLYRGLCKQLTYRTTYQQGLSLKLALKQKSCAQFAKHFHAGTRPKS